LYLQQSTYDATIYIIAVNSAPIKFIKESWSYVAISFQGIVAIKQTSRVKNYCSRYEQATINQGWRKSLRPHR
jgi:hypothetical protein